MKDIFYKYYNNLLSFKDYNLREIFMKVVPQGNDVFLDEKRNKEITMSSLYLILFITVCTLFEQLVQIDVKLPFFSAYTHPLKTTFQEVVMAHLSSIIVIYVFSLIVPLLILWYFKTFGKSRQKTWFHYFLIIYSIAVIVSSIFKILHALKYLFSAFLFTLVVIASRALLAFISITILKHSIDECINAYNQNKIEISGSASGEVVNIGQIQVEDDGSGSVDINKVREENNSYTDISELEIQDAPKDQIKIDYKL